MKYGEIKHFARQLRNNPTPAEAKLWVHLKKRQLNGRKFLRQHPLLYDFNKSEYFYFIPDFYCYQELLIIELDGPIHDIQVDRDLNRQEILVHTGFRMIRFRNEELNDMKRVLDRIAGCFRG